MKIIGIDLGTTNTYMYGCTRSEGKNVYPSPAPLIVPPLSDQAGSIATAVLYENDNPILAGNIAEQEFYTNLAAQPQRRLASQFKPEISRGEKPVLAAMTDFLRLLRLAAGQEIEPDTEVFVGMPSLSREDYALHLSRCFSDAGWPKPSFVRESDAALVSCLQSGILDIDDLEKECMILDFGGGTCDFTTVSSLDVLQNGGDLLYGGRLLDDLIFQLFCRENPDFAASLPSSPYQWYVHWVACREQKEDFSDFLRKENASLTPGDAASSASTTLHVTWFDDMAVRHDAYVEGYNCERFLSDAENYSASPEMLALLESYLNRGGLSIEARDFLEGRQIGLISWLRSILETVNKRAQVAKVILTGGSSRWFFVPELIARVFPNATWQASNRSYEDIAFGLALYPVLLESREKVQELLQSKLGLFAARAGEMVKRQVQDKTAGLIKLCSERIVEHDVLPVLVNGSRESLTIASLEEQIRQNIHQDEGLKEISEKVSAELTQDLQRDLEFSFRHWLNENGVLLMPRFSFPARDIGELFVHDLNVGILVKELNIMKFTLDNLLPLLAGVAVGGAVAHGGEPVTASVSGLLTFGLTWAGARTLPGFMARRKLPRFFLNETWRNKIVSRNREYIEKAMRQSLEKIEKQLVEDAEGIVRRSLSGMLGRLSVLNQIQVG